MVSRRQLQLLDTTMMTGGRSRRRPRPGQRSCNKLHCLLTTAAAMAILPRKCSAESALLGVNTQTRRTPLTNGSTRQNGGGAGRRMQKTEFTSAGTVYSSCPDLNYIIGPMNEADADNNGVLNQEEYTQFADSISGGYLTDQGWSDGFTDMPLSLRETYLVLSCLCELYPDQPWGGPGCCESGGIRLTGIRTDGTAPGETPDEAQTQYLTYVCGTMDESLENVDGDLVRPPNLTPSPTNRPTAEPTNRITRRPTELPTKQPSKMPTMKPTTLEPTMKPTMTPTSKPTQIPTLQPSPSPTKRPTQPPVEAGTPTESPITESPTTKSPTKQPTPVPVEESFPPTPSPVGSNPDPQPGTPTKEPTKEPAVPTTKEPVVPTTQEPVPTKEPVPTTEPAPEEPTTKSPSGDVLDSPPPTQSPTTSSPTLSPSISFPPTATPTASPTESPTVSVGPTVSFSPSASPTTSSLPTISTAPTIATFTGDVRASVDFVASLNGEVTASEVMNGTTNQVKTMLEEQLLVLSDIVIAELFHNGTLPAGNSTTESDGGPKMATTTAEERSGGPKSRADGDVRMLLLRMRKVTSEEGERMLIVERATLATVDDVADVACPPGSPQTECLNFNNTILLYMVDEPASLVDEKVEMFERAMLDKIADGWLADNFDLEEALQPPPSPNPGTDPEDGDRAVDDSKLSTGAIIGIVIAAVFCFVATLLFVSRQRNKERNDGGEYDLERQQALGKDVDESDLAAAQDLSVADEDSSAPSAERSYTSHDPLLQQGQVTSSASMLQPALGQISTEPEDDDSAEEIGQAFSTPEAMQAAREIPSPAGEQRDIDSSPYGGWAAAEARSAREQKEEGDFPDLGDLSGAGRTSAAAAAGGPLGGVEGGINTGAAAALGAAGGGLAAAGIYAVTRSSKSEAAARSRSPYAREESHGSSTSVSSPRTQTESTSTDTAGVSASSDTRSSSTPPLVDLDNAIETGNWGQVGALAAVLASQGHGRPKSQPSLGDAGSKSGSRSGGSEKQGGASLDQARAVEIDKLVEAGDWQGVVLAAARFEADQTFDGESSYSASASQSSRWTGGSATSATTPRSAATSASPSNTSGGQGRNQEEIRNEVEALVRRVVPEEADNIDEMMTQFKGREEELVETLRRMQERAIASRARLAVQKSAKLEARAKASPNRGGGRPDGASVGSATSMKSGSSELEHAIESGNWQAVGEAAQKMSAADGDLSVEEKARIREAISQSPAFNRRIRPSSTTSGIESDDDFHLNELIERGDWSGVIAAAKAAASSEGGSDTAAGGDVSTEEQDALAQANMWQEIADQSKQEAGQGPAGAGDAAAWAIQRSLRALDTSADSAQQAVRTINDIADDDDSGDASQYESSSFSDSMGRSSEDFAANGDGVI